MTFKSSELLNANGLPLPSGDVQVIKNGTLPTISELDVRELLWVFAACVRHS